MRQSQPSRSHEHAERSSRLGSPIHDGLLTRHSSAWGERPWKTRTEMELLRLRGRTDLKWSKMVRWPAMYKFGGTNAVSKGSAAVPRRHERCRCGDQRSRRGPNVVRERPAAERTLSSRDQRPHRSETNAVSDDRRLLRSGTKAVSEGSAADPRRACEAVPWHARSACGAWPHCGAAARAWALPLRP